MVGFYAIYDEENQGVKLVDDEEYNKVKSKVTSGKPNIDSINYEACRDRMRFKPIVIRRFQHSPIKPSDLLAVYDSTNQSVIAVTRADYEKNKVKYEANSPSFSAPTIKPVIQEPTPTTQTIADTPKLAAQVTPKPIEKISPKVETPDLVCFQNVNNSDIQPEPIVSSNTSVKPPTDNIKEPLSHPLFCPPLIGPIKLCPDDLMIVYNPVSQGVQLVTRAQFDAGLMPSDTTSAPPTAAPSPSPQTQSHPLFTPPMIPAIEHDDEDLVAVYDEETQSVKAITRAQFKQLKS